MDNATKVISWNSRGFGENKSIFISDNTDKTNTIVCVQEHFILRKNAYKVLNAFSDMHVFFKPAVKNNLDKGRPRGGLSIAIPTSIKKYVQDISPTNWRLQVLRFER